MCRFTHPLAAIGTMSWPLFEVPGPGGAHPRAFLVRSGTIRWPRLRVRKHSLAKTAGWYRAPARTKLLINVSFHVKLYVCHRAHVQRKPRMRKQITSGSGSWSRSGTFGLLLTARCRFVRVRACGPTAQPVPRGKAIAAMYFTVAAVGNAFRSMCPKNSWRISSWPWRTDVVSRI